MSHIVSIPVDYKHRQPPFLAVQCQLPNSLFFSISPGHNFVSIKGTIVCLKLLVVILVLSELTNSDLYQISWSLGCVKLVVRSCYTQQQL